MKHYKVKKEKLRQIFSRVFAAIMSVALIFGVVVSDYNQVKATGVEELLYYTYWDLISSLGYATGYNIDYNVDFDNSNTISGKDVWDAFCDFVSYKPMADYEQDYLDRAMSELKALPENATSDGISISQDLYDWLCDIFAITAGDTTNSISTNIAKYAPTSDAVPFGHMVYVHRDLGWGITDDSYMGVAVSLGNVRFLYNYGLNGSKDINYYVISSSPFDIATNASWAIDDNSPHPVKNTINGYYYYGFASFADVVTYTPLGTRIDCTIDDYLKSLPVASSYTSVSIPEVITSTPVANPVDVKDDTIPWVVSTQYWTVERTETDTGSSSGSGSDDEDDKKKDRLPVIIPFVWPSTDPDSTEEETESESESESETTGTGTDTDTDTDTDIDEETLTDTVNSVLSNGGKITQVFPFCIPFDIVSMIKGMKSAKKAPVWHFKYYFKPIDYTFEFTVDMSDYEQYIKIFRAGFVIFYVITLMLLTIRYSSGIVKD